MKTIKKQQAAWDEGRRASGLNRWDYEAQFGPRPVNQANERRKEKKAQARHAAQRAVVSIDPTAEAVRHLEWAAGRVDYVSDAATLEQCALLGRLLIERGEDAIGIGYGPADSAGLTKRAASAWIDRLKNQ